MNIVYVRGRLSRPAEQRVLDSGTVIVNYQVTVARDDGPADSVPVVWADPPSPEKAAEYDAGDEVIALGRVRRRFFKAGGTTQSRTEVVAETVVPMRQARKAATLLARRCEDVVG